MASHPVWSVMCAPSCLLGQMTWLRTLPLPFTSCENLRGSFNPLKSHPHIKQAEYDARFLKQMKLVKGLVHFLECSKSFKNGYVLFL